MPTAFGKSFPLPEGIIPKVTEEPAKPFTTSCAVPSPPTATIWVYPLSTPSFDNSAAWPGSDVKQRSYCMLFESKTDLIDGTRFCVFPLPAMGFIIIRYLMCR
jgi:hypothetical protein